MNKYKKSKKKQPDNDLKKSTLNLSLNILIFFLLALVIYLIFSIYMKLTGESKNEVINPVNEIPAEIIQIEVLNGCGVSGLADRFTDYLRSQKIDVVNTGNYVSYDIDKSIVIDRIGNKANAYRVAEVLGIKKDKVIQQLNENYLLDVTLIIGKDYYNLTPLN